MISRKLRNWSAAGSLIAASAGLIGYQTSAKNAAPPSVPPYSPPPVVSTVSYHAPVRNWKVIPSDSSLNSPMLKNVPQLFYEHKYAAGIMDAISGDMMYGINENRQCFPASITKLMTLFLTFEEIERKRLKLEDTLVVDRIDPRVHDQIKLLCVGPNEHFTVEQAIEGMLIHSANDAADILGKNIAGNLETFIQMMNERAISLGMCNSHFTNTCGVNEKGKNDPKQVMTVADILTLMRSIQQFFPELCAKFKITEMPFHGLTLKTHSALPGADMGKTGWTYPSAYCIVSSFPAKTGRVIVADVGAMTAKGRNEHTLDLADIGKAKLASKAAQNTEDMVNHDGPLPFLPAKREITQLQDVNYYGIEKQAHNQLYINLANITSWPRFELKDSAVIVPQLAHP